MPEAATLLAFAAVSLGFVLTPGPNMIYLVSRAVAQGPRAGVVSLAGTVLGFLVYMLLAAFGLTALALAVPYAYEALRYAGAAYLLWLAWQAVKPGARPVLSTQPLPPVSDARLFVMGVVTNLLNPKIAILYASLLPQFVDASRGDVLAQSLALGATQIAVSASVNLAFVLAAGSVTTLLARRPLFAVIQRWLMATVLAGLALRIATERR